MRLGAIVAVTAAIAGATGCGVQRGADETIEARAARLAHEAILIDTHVDLPYWLKGELIDITARTGAGHFDLPRAREGGLDAPFMSIYVSADSQDKGTSKADAEALIDLVERIAETWPGQFVVAATPAEVRAAKLAGKIALPLGMENGAPLETLADVGHFRERGISYVTLTHSRANRICDSSYADEPTWNGLSPYGREVVGELNRVGIMVDISHVSDATFDQVIELSRAPVIASHSSCRHFTPGFERNLDDERIRLLAAMGGVIQINFGSAFLTEAAQEQSATAWATVQKTLDEQHLDWSSPQAQEKLERYWQEHPPVETSVADVADHIEHVVELAGIDHVGLGSDFDGVEHVPVGLEDVSGYPNLIAELLSRGYSDEDVRKVCGENLLRVWQHVLDAAETR